MCKCENGKQDQPVRLKRIKVRSSGACASSIKQFAPSIPPLPPLKLNLRSFAINFLSTMDRRAEGRRTPPLSTFQPITPRSIPQQNVSTGCARNVRLHTAYLLNARRLNALIKLYEKSCMRILYVAPSFWTECFFVRATQGFDSQFITLLLINSIVVVEFFLG